MSNSKLRFDRRQWSIYGWICLFGVLAVVLFSVPSIRGIAIYPLYVHQADATGEVAYVMAGGPAYWERLRAATDLYHQERISRIIILAEKQSVGYDYSRNRTETREERGIRFLEFSGVPATAIISVPQDVNASFGSLSEAESVSNSFPELKSIVVVTSAPHTRRSLLCFQRRMPDTDVQIYSASGVIESDEIYSPIWAEYCKLLVYYFVA